ncbi:hypothetical protein SAMN05216357_11946 [Porphyromonadaceae bacterium KH3CP3RA]|nr:hypothetical protein SAMN05216357_11946 [Porphyromonadaceae bacterium KH3CP3RA]
MLSRLYANQRENCNENGAKSYIWGEIGYSGVKKMSENLIILVNHQ